MLCTRYIPKVLQFRHPAGTSRGVYTSRHIWLVEVWDDAMPEMRGIGECAPLPDLSPDESSAYQFGLETAFLSLRAQQVGNSPWHLFDTAFSRGEVGISINGLVWMGTRDEMFSRMDEKLREGFQCIKLKIGAIKWDEEIELIKSLRSRYSSKDVELRVDANGGFSPHEVMSRLEELSKYQIHSIEQPIMAGLWNDMEKICAQSPLPVAFDEELIGHWDDKAELLETLRPHYVVLKPSLHGGMKGCEEWIKLASARGIGYWVTSALESNVGLNAISQWASHVSRTIAPSSVMAQGLGTGKLFVENIPGPQLEIKGNKIYCR